MFAGRDFRALAGNLDRWPEAVADAQGWLEFPLNLPSGAGRARARAFVLGPELRLLVGRDVQELRDVERLIVTAMAWGLALTIALAVVGGMLISRGTLRRIEINATTEAANTSAYNNANRKVEERNRPACSAMV